MDRYIFKDLLEWKSGYDRKPLLFIGARRVGKTWLMKEFGKRYFKHVAYFSFDRKPKLMDALEDTLAPKEFLPILQSEAGVPIDPKNTLIIFDEIQDSTAALRSLKYFYEDAPEYCVAAAGSTLGLLLHKQTSFPVGAVEMKNVFPLSFFEFLKAIGEEKLVRYLEENPPKRYKPFHEKLNRYLRVYMYVGGMPGVINEYIKSGDLGKVRRAQNSILDTYYADFAKYTNTTAQATRLRMLWKSIPAQLSKENKKFRLGAVKTEARGRDYETSIMWMEDSSLVRRVHRVTEPKPPLKVYEDMRAFKLFLNDVGLLCAMTNVGKEDIADEFALFTQFKGALAEQFVFQEVRQVLTRGVNYWSNPKGNAEIDFLTMDQKSNVIPIEVKSGFNLRSKSLSVYMKEFMPKYAIRTSLSGFMLSKNEEIGIDIIDIPLYALANCIKKILGGIGIRPDGEYKAQLGDPDDFMMVCEEAPVFGNEPYWDKIVPNKIYKDSDGKGLGNNEIAEEKYDEKSGSDEDEVVQLSLF